MKLKWVCEGNFYPGQPPVDDECHCLTSCVVGRVYPPQLFQSIASTNSKFTELSNDDKFKYLVCPTNNTDCKLVSRFLQKQFIERNKIDTDGFWSDYIGK